jgi:DNA-binding Lrp family transcriptional regulator
MEKEIEIQYSTPIMYGEQFGLDKKDNQIIKALYINARMPLSKMRKHVNLTRDGIKYRIKRMIKNGVIQSFIPVLNPPKMGFNSMNYVFFSMQNFSIENEKGFIKYLKGLNNVIYISKLVGRMDFLVFIIARNPEHFNDILRNIRGKFSGIIKEYEIMSVIQEYKFIEMDRLLD